MPQHKDIPARQPRYGGLTYKQVAWARQLEGLTQVAIARLGELVQSSNEAVAITAVKEVLNRNLGMPKQRAEVDVTVSGHVAHHQVLMELANAARSRVGAMGGQVLELTATEDQQSAEDADISTGYEDDVPEDVPATLESCADLALQPGSDERSDQTGQPPPEAWGPPSPPVFEHPPPAPEKNQTPRSALEAYQDAVRRLGATERPPAHARRAPKAPTTPDPAKPLHGPPIASERQQLEPEPELPDNLKRIR